MPCYSVCGQRFYSLHSIPELNLLEINEGSAIYPDIYNASSLKMDVSPEFITSVEGWVGGEHRIIEVLKTSSEFLLRIENCGEYFIDTNRETIGKLGRKEGLSQLDCEIILGPVFILALALRGVWSLHASAVMYKENVIVFLGDSGKGKSTLASYLSKNTAWQLISDDILPIQLNGREIDIFPKFPQLKISKEDQPWIDLPERMPLKIICGLEQTDSYQMPQISKSSVAQGVHYLLGHIAGARMFDAVLLSKHLEFSTEVAKQIPAYRLIYPHRKDTLFLIREFLENLC